MTGEHLLHMEQGVSLAVERCTQTSKWLRVPCCSKQETCIFMFYYTPCEVSNLTCVTSKL